MKVLITGGAGFIGSHLAEKLLAHGHDIVVLDDLSTGSRDNLRSLAAHPRFQLVEGSVLDDRLLEGLFEQVDQVYHLASAVGVRLIIEQPVKTIETIVQGTDQVLRMACRFRRPVLLTSSSEVYGQGTRVPFDEGQDVVLGPTSTRRWLYACAKMLDEFLALAHWHETRLPVICVRLFNTVGPRQTGQYGMVLPRFVQQALAGEPLTVYGTGLQSRCFCHVEDVCRGLIGLMHCPEARGQVVNIGSSEEISIHDLARRVIAMTGSQSPITLVPYDQAFEQGFDDMQRRVPDLSRAAGLIGYAPRYRLDDIIASVIDYWRNR